VSTGRRVGGVGITILLLVVSATACGRSADEATAGSKAGVDGCSSGELPVTASLMALANVWASVSDLRVGDGAGGGTLTVTYGGFERLTPETFGPPVDLSVVSSSGVLEKRVAEGIKSVDPSKHDFLLGFGRTSLQRGNPTVRDAITIDRSTHNASFVGNCGHDQQLTALTKRAAGMTSGDVVRTLIREPDGELARSLTKQPETNWNELPIDQRYLDPDLAPPDVMAGLTEINVKASVPDSWYGVGKLLCLRTPLGWSGSCERLSESRHKTLTMKAYVDGTQSAEVVVRIGEDRSAPVRVIGVLTPEQLARPGIEFSISESGALVVSDGTASTTSP
jgi:hypothetical protein